MNIFGGLGPGSGGCWVANVKGRILGGFLEFIQGGAGPRVLGEAARTL